MVDRYNIPYSNFQAGDDIEPTQFNSDFVYIEDTVNELYTNSLNFSTKKAETIAPIDIPTSVGAIYVNTANGNIYISKGTTTVSDWVKIYPQI